MLYDYDSTDQVKTVTGSNSEAYTYDSNGNRTSGGYITDAGNRLRSDGTYNYEYDDEGNRTTRTKIADGTVDTYGWDYRNRLMGIVTKDLDGVVTRSVGYTYDVDDLRISKTVDGVVEHYYLDGEQIAFVTDGGGHETFHYLYGLNIDQVLAQDSETGMVWALADRLGSVDALADADGNVLDERTFDSFGRLISETNPSVSFRYGYTGRELDLESGLDYYRARYYDSAVGRFISVDPMGFGAGDTNLYRYVGNNSTNNTDPSGMISWSEVQDYAYGGLVNTDKFVAGFAHFMTGGYTTQLRNEVYEDKVAGQHEGLLFNAGQVAGFGVSLALGFKTPNALFSTATKTISAAERIAQGYTVAQTGIGAFNTTAKIQDGQMDWSNPLSYLEVAGSFAPAIGFGVGKAWNSNAVQSGLAKFDAFATKAWNTNKIKFDRSPIGTSLKQFGEDWGELWEKSARSNLDWVEGLQAKNGIKNIEGVDGIKGIHRIDIIDKGKNGIAKRIRINMDKYPEEYASRGNTDMFGNTMIDLRQESNILVRQTSYHEDFHGFLSVNRTSPFSRTRATLSQYMYENNQLLRWAEEAGSEAYSLIRTRNAGSSKMKISTALNEGRKFPLGEGYRINGETVVKQFAALTAVTGTAWYGSYKYGETLTNNNK